MKLAQWISMDGRSRLLGKRILSTGLGFAYNLLAKVLDRLLFLTCRRLRTGIFIRGTGT